MNARTMANGAPGRRADSWEYVRRMAEVLAEAIDAGYVPAVLVDEVLETERRMRERAAQAAARGGVDRWYRGELIQRAARNSSGIRWYASVNQTGLRADTLAGIKQLIRDQLAAS